MSGVAPAACVHDLVSIETHGQTGCCSLAAWERNVTADDKAPPSHACSRFRKEKAASLAALKLQLLAGRQNRAYFC